MDDSHKKDEALDPILSPEPTPQGALARALSTDHTPPPLMISTMAIPSASRWYSKPSPCWVPDQFMKKPCDQWTVAIATSITQAIPIFSSTIPLLS